MAIELYDDEKLYDAENVLRDVPAKKSRFQLVLKYVLGALILSAAAAATFGPQVSKLIGVKDAFDESSLCPIHDKRAPKSYYIDNSTVEYILRDHDFKMSSVEKLSKAVQIDTSVYDDYKDVSESPETWTKFAAFHTYLEKTFPTIYANLKVETVNTYALVYTWKGSDESLKPLLLTAHQDVVPVQSETIGDWDYPPFEGHFDGEFLYGRGVIDCKNLLVGLMETVEVLLAKNFQPKRTLILAFGADEEISGFHFASKIGKFLEERYGKNSLYAIIDEGTGSLEKIDGVYVAAPSTAEKGYTDILLELTTPGGHSSIPPDHTSIGMMSDLLTLLEANPFPAVLSEKNPALEYSQCIAKYSKVIEPTLKKNLLRAGFDKVANSKAVEYFLSQKMYRYLIKTSQAIDIIKGGAKANALPEHVEVTVNHRVGFDSSTQETYDRSLGFVAQIAKKYDLGLILTDGTEYMKPTANGYFTMTMKGRTEPVPLAPTSADVWSLYSGALRHFYEDVIFEGNLTEPIIVAPNVPTGNTDTRHYLQLSEHIYRCIPAYTEVSLIESGVHSVNERIPYDMHLQTIAFYYEYLQLVLDEAI